MNNNRVYLGSTKSVYGRNEPIYLYDFEWSCGWYWTGGYLGNRNLHCHFNDCFLKTPDIRGHVLGNFVTPWNRKEGSVVIANGCSIWEDLSTFLNNPSFDGDTWWRIKDLFKQFYRLRDAAEVFLYGGHCISKGRTEKEINPEMAKSINLHIQNVIIPEIRKIVGLEGENPVMTIKTID
jgi:hypothetical protein